MQLDATSGQAQFLILKSYVDLRSGVMTTKTHMLLRGSLLAATSAIILFLALAQTGEAALPKGGLSMYEISTRPCIRFYISHRAVQLDDQVQPGHHSPQRDSRRRIPVDQGPRC